MTQKNSLSIRLTESVVFLRGASHLSGRRRDANTESQAMLRGLLTLNVVKPMRISSIEIDLVGKSKTAWPEGIGSRRVEVAEAHQIFYASTVFFRASKGQPSTTRRSTSVGPACALDLGDFEQDDSAVEDDPTHYVRRESSPSPARTTHRVSRRMSADQSIYQRQYVSHRIDPPMPATPPYSPVSVLSPTLDHSQSPHGIVGSNGVSSPRPEERPQQRLEEFRNALQTGIENMSPRVRRGDSDPTAATNSSASSITSEPRTSMSRRVSIDEEPEEYSPPSPNIASPPPLASPTRSITSPQSSTLPDSEPNARGRRNTARFSFASMSSSLFDVMKDRVRSSSPRSRNDPTTHERGRSKGKEPVRGPRGSTTPPGRARPQENGTAKMHKEKTAFGKLGGALGFDIDDHAESGDGWKEFHKGTYTYPISFAIPTTAPPTLHLDYGSVTYRLKAYVHRPGAFRSKMTAVREVLLVACPGEDDLEAQESIIVERQWDTQMQYMIAVSGRCFPIGGTVPIDMTFLPTEKVKIYRIAVVLDERVEYFTQFRHIARSDPVRRFELLSIKYPQKDAPPLLPLYSDSVDAFTESPLYPIVVANSSNPEEVSEVGSTFMGPGPWSIHHELQLPASCGRLHFTNKHRKSNVMITHVLRFVLRVERGDGGTVTPSASKDGKPKLFDIVVQAPVHILSCRCNLEYTSLPQYSLFSDDIVNKPDSCPCSVKRRRAALDAGSGLNTPQAPGLSRGGSRWSDSSSVELADTMVISGGSLLDQTSLFARLVSGQESEMGEAPPSYASLVH